MKNVLVILSKAIILISFIILYFCLLLTDSLNAFTLVFGILSTLLFSVIIHEFAHLACAIAIGLKNYCIEISVLGIERKHSKTIIYFKNNNVFHGSCACDYNPNISLKKYALFCRIGGFSNLAVFILSIIAIIFLNSAILRFHMTCQAITSLYDFSVNCLFKRSSDILLLKSILKRKETR